jgi:hypothetical protein
VDSSGSGLCPVAGSFLSGDETSVLIKDSGFLE